MTNLQSDIQQVELTLEEAKKIVAFGEAISRLEKNADYRAIYTDGYFRDEASRLALLSGDPNIDEKVREKVFLSIRSIGELFDYLRTKKMMADLMVKDVQDAEQALEEMHREDAESEG